MIIPTYFSNEYLLESIAFQIDLWIKSNLKKHRLKDIYSFKKLISIDLKCFGSARR